MMGSGGINEDREDIQIFEIDSISEGGAPQKTKDVN